jgi:DNA (cytosine-5)-methyltransferase 1
MILQTGPEIRARRETLGLSQARLAKAASVPQRLLSDFELGHIRLDDERIDRLASLLGDRKRARAIAMRAKLRRAPNYAPVAHDPERVARAVPSVGNAAYLRSLARLMNSPTPRGRAVSLFSGCGGFSLGFRAAGFEILGHVEKDPRLRALFQTNFPASRPLGEDIALLADFPWLGEIDVLIGGPPCQGFSLTGRRDAGDPRNALFRHYLAAVERLRPKAAVMENVRPMSAMLGPEGRPMKREILSTFRALGYRVAAFEADACDYGAPQHRQRVFYIALRADLGSSPTFPSPAHGEGRAAHRTLADACSDLAFLESGEASADPLHVAVCHPRHVLDWLWDTPEGASAHDNPDQAHRPPSGYNTTYKRQVWNAPAATVQTTFGMISGSRNVHPIATRALTFREAARLQTFPDSFAFSGTAGTLRAAIGNAVPPLLAQAIGEHLVRTLA